MRLLGLNSRHGSMPERVEHVRVAPFNPFGIVSAFPERDAFWFTDEPHSGSLSAMTTLFGETE